MGDYSVEFEPHATSLELEGKGYVVASLGEDIRKAANEKFQRINDAKERIYKSRSIK